MTKGSPREAPIPPADQPVAYIGDPWERQPWDTTLEYERFMLWLFMGSTRTLRALSEQLGLQYEQLWRTTTKLRWRERAAAYDKHARAEALRQLEEGDIQARLTHVALAEQMLAKLTRRAASLHPDEIEVRDIAPLTRTMVAVSRQGRGMDTEKVAVDVTVTAADLSPDEKRDMMAALAAELARRAVARAEAQDGE